MASNYLARQPQANQKSSTIWPSTSVDFKKTLRSNFNPFFVISLYTGWAEQAIESVAFSIINANRECMINNTHHFVWNVIYHL